MSWFRDSKQDDVRQQIHQYCDLVGAAVAKFETMVDDYLQQDKAFKEESRQVHELEHEADILRYDIERRMFEGAFLAAYREDYIDLLEEFDRVANKAEEVADFVYLTRPLVYQPIVEDLRKIVTITVRAFKPLRELINKILDQDFDVHDDVVKIAELESEIDTIQFEATKKVFKDPDMERVEKLILLQFIDKLGKVSDRLENVADRVSIIAIKRRLG